jgi:hypothetical protein
LNKEFIPYEEALALKELGFDEPCFGYYVGLGDNKETPFKLIEIQSEREQFKWVDNVCHAPLYQQAFKWFRDKGYDVEIVIYHFHGGYVGKKFKYLIYNFDEDKIKNSDNVSDGEFEILLSMINPDNSQDSYEEAELACLRHLIKTVKEHGGGEQ